MSQKGSALDWLAKAACALLYAASGVVLGFCGARWVGPLILRGSAGAGMADLGYMFTGATLGGFAGLALGVHKALGRSTRDALRGSLVAVGLAALAFLITALAARLLLH